MMVSFMTAALAFLAPAGLRARAPMEKRSMLAGRLLELSRQPRLEPKDVAAILGSRLGAARKTTSVRTEYDLAATELIAGGTVATANAWRLVSVQPAASVGLVLQDLEPHLLDSPYRMDVTTARMNDGPAILSLDHQFLVRAGMLVVRVPPRRPRLPTHGDELERAYGERWDTVAGTRTVRDPVIEVLLSGTPMPALVREITLRAFRDRARKAAAAQ